MCGVCGILKIGNKKMHVSNIEKMTCTISHRGPDEYGYYKDDTCHLGHRRLSVLDLTGSHQPMKSRCARYVLSYNGEIYNFRELREKLILHGLTFKTQGDTEVLAEGLACYGSAFLKELNGMFAFALWDKKEKTLLIGRDHIGIKPLYYSLTSDYFLFASEVKSILASGYVKKEINRNSLFEYLCRLSPIYGETLYKGIYELKAGNFIVISCKGKLSQEKYFQLESSWEKNKIKENKKSLAQILKRELSETVKKQMVRDIPVGLFLSAGVDSSLLLKIMNEQQRGNINIFTYRNPSGIDESLISRQCVEKISPWNKHFILSVPLSQYLEHIKKINWYFDCPIAYPSSIPLFFLAKIAKTKGTKVILSGQGADELFLGYDRYLLWAKKLIKEKNKKVWAENFYFGSGINNAGIVEKITGINRETINTSETFKWVLEFWDLPPLKRMAIYDQKFRLNGLLKRDDCMGMSAGVECRVPFLDKEFLNLINSIPDSYKMNKLKRKIILKEIAREALPTGAYQEKKHGSPSELEAWLKTPRFLFSLKNLSNKKNSFTKSYLNFKSVDQIFKSHENTQKFSFLCWCIYGLETWYQEEFK